MFEGATFDLEHIPNSSKWLEDVPVGAIKSYSNLFSRCRGKIKSLHLAGLAEKAGPDNAGKSMANIVTSLPNLTEIYLGNSINFESLDKDFLATYSPMIESCRNLRSIYVGNNVTLRTANLGRTCIYNCPNLVGRKGSTFSNGANYQYCRIDEGPDKPGIFCGIYNAEVKGIPVKDAYFRGEKINKMIVGRDLINLEKEGN